jgi:hypothetical protein
METDAAEIKAVAPGGWYDDPEVPGQERYWDGTAWTIEVRAKEEAPAPPPMSPPPSQEQVETEAAAERAVPPAPAVDAPPARTAQVTSSEPAAPVVPPTAGTVPAAAPSAIPTAPAGTPVAAAKVMPAEWPVEGYTGPQPWEADNPPELTQNRLMLSSGMCGKEVVELAALLGYLGYTTNINTGQNPHGVYDQGVSGAVEAFCRDYGVAEDPAILRARTPDTVGPWIWEALVRAVHSKAEATQTS